MTLFVDDIHQQVRYIWLDIVVRPSQNVINIYIIMTGLPKHRYEERIKGAKYVPESNTFLN